MKLLSFWSGPLLGLLLGYWLSIEMTPEMGGTLGLSIWVACWWIFEPIPIPATSLIPFVGFPLLGVLSNKEVAGAYGHWLILLLVAV